MYNTRQKCQLLHRIYFCHFTLSWFLLKSPIFTVGFGNPFVVIRGISVITCPNMHLPLWISHCWWLSLSLTAWLPVPPWLESVRLFHVRRWEAGQYHAGHCSHPQPEKKSLQSASSKFPVMSAMRLVTVRLESEAFSNVSFFSGHISATESIKHSLINFPSENALLFLGISLLEIT